MLGVPAYRGADMLVRCVAAVSLSLAALLGAGSLTACSPTDNTDSPTVSAAAPSGSANACQKSQLSLINPGTFTVATDNPAYEPWFSDNKPSNGKGYESAVAYAVAKQLGFAANEVTWVTASFNSVVTPGRKNFDVDI